MSLLNCIFRKQRVQRDRRRERQRKLAATRLLLRVLQPARLQQQVHGVPRPRVQSGQVSLPLAHSCCSHSHSHVILLQVSDWKRSRAEAAPSLGSERARVWVSRAAGAQLQRVRRRVLRDHQSEQTFVKHSKKCDSTYLNVFLRRVIDLDSPPTGRQPSTARSCALDAQ